MNRCVLFCITDRTGVNHQMADVTGRISSWRIDPGVNDIRLNGENRCQKEVRLRGLIERCVQEGARNKGKRRGLRVFPWHRQTRRAIPSISTRESGARRINRTLLPSAPPRSASLGRDTPCALTRSPRACARVRRPSSPAGFRAVSGSRFRTRRRRCGIGRRCGGTGGTPRKLAPEYPRTGR